MATISRSVVIYGATFPGLVAARKIAAMGFSVAVLEWTSHIGGLTTGGLGKGDVVTGTRWGLVKAFLVRIGANPPYNLTDGSEVWNFAPSEAIRAMNEVLLDSASVTVVTGARLKHITKQGTRIISATLRNGDVYEAPIWLDCSYEGDLAALAGVAMSYGRDSWHKFRERIERTDIDTSKPGLNVEGADHEDFKSVDSQGNLYPWRTWPPAPWVPEMSPSARSQAYGWRFCLSKRSDRLPWPQPPGYSRQEFAWVGDMIANNGGAGGTFPLRLSAFEVSGTGSGIYVCNGGDLPGIFTNPWPAASYEKRIAIQERAYRFAAGILYFAATDPAVSQAYRTNLNSWGLPAAEFQADYIGSPGWPSAYYVRQARTMVGQYVMTSADMFDDGSGTNWYKPDSIGVGGYFVDAHPYYWYPTPDLLTLEEGKLDYSGLKRYSVPLRSILPHPGQASNLLVPVCASASTLVMNSLRMEFTWGVLCESAGTLAGLALAGGVDIGQVPYATLRARLLADGAILAI